MLRAQSRPLIAVLIASGLAAAAGAVGAQTLHYDADTWGAAADTLHAPAAGERITLSSPFIVPGSVHVEVDGAPVPADDYQVNEQLGTIRFRTAIPPDAVVIVSYRRQPFLLRPVFTLRPAEVSPPDSVEVPPERAPVERAAATPAGPSLVFGGTKSVSFSTGTNRGSTLDQSLEATAEGQLTPTIHVRALLSDNNLPIQPEGNTEELQYFDRVFVEVEGPNARAAVGDIALDDRTSSFSPLTRQLRGISASAWTQRGRIVGAAAETKGQFRTVSTRGTNGLQGPYPLLSQARTTRDVIIAGTERVLVDGVRAERGPNRDYVIDYDAGTITFTPRRLITSDTEIAVDFEVTQDQYDRSTVLGGVEEVLLGDGVRAGFAIAREADDKSRPKGTILSKEEIAVLEAAGDDPDRAITGGVQPTDPGKGDYVLVPADTLAGTPAHYRFAEAAGDFLVSFVEVGTGKGDYRRAGISPRGSPYFEFVGAGNGIYVVGKRLPLPEAANVMTARIGRETGTLTFDGEWNVSDHDANLFSSLDDGDNVGHAGQARIGLSTRGPWRLGVTAAGSLLEDRFYSFDRARPAYYYRDWNLEDVPLSGGRELTGEVGASAARNGVGRLHYALGRLERPGFDGNRQEAGLQSGDLADRGLSVHGLSTDMNGDDNVRTRRNLSVEGSWGVWDVVPGVSYATETYRNAFTAAADSGRAYDLVSVRLGRRYPGRITWQLSGQRRDTRGVDAATDAFIDTRRDDTYNGLFSYRSTGAAQAEVQLTHHRETDRTTGAGTTTDLARIKATGAWDAIGLRADVDYEVSQNSVATLQRSVIFVGDGKGDYNELGEPVGKGKGDFTVVYLPTTDSTPVHSVGFNLHLVWKASEQGRGKSGAGAWILRNVSLDQTLGVREESTYEPAWKVYVLVPWALQRDDDTVFGTTTLRQDWSLLNGYKNVSLTLRYLREDNEDNRFEGVNESSFAGEHALRLSRSLSARWTATVEAGRRIDRRGGEGIAAGSGSAYDVEERSLLGGLGVSVTPGATIDLDVTGATAHDSESDAEQRTITVAPRVVWRVADQVNVFGNYELSDVKDVRTPASKPLVFAREGTSQRWSLTPNVRVSRVITVFATYSGRSERVFSGKRVVEHEFRLETRAYF